MSASAARLIVGIPVRNEVDRITSCLQALAGQQGARIDRVVLLLNNCTDGTAGLVRAFQAVSALDVDLCERILPPHEAHAGHARRLVMQLCAEWAGSDDVLLTTDADGRVAPDWAARNIAALEAGADVVCGRVELDPVEAALIPAVLHEDDARECAYDALLDEIHAHLDPDPADPLPRHTEASGASIAMTTAIYRRCGGVPAIPLGEDRALIAALRSIGARIRHAPDVRVVVSGRIDGRAVGGMADTIRRRLGGPDPSLDDRLEPASDCARRAALRGFLREAGGQPSLAVRRVLADAAGLDIDVLDRLLDQPVFGLRWQAIEAAGVNLHRQRVTIADLPAEMAAAEAICVALRRDGAVSVGGADRDDSRALAVAAPG